MIRVLIVDDSPTVRTLLRAIFAEDAGLEVVGQASNGQEAVKLARELAPDVVTMDVLMPGMGGLEATREIMIESPTRVVIVSGNTDVHEVAGSMQALRLGAVTVLPKPPGPEDPQFSVAAAELVRTVKSMSQVKVVRQWRNNPAARGALQNTTRIALQARRVEVIAVASSTGGPNALQQILGGLPAGFSVPILVVQHMPVGFTQGLADWLNSSCALKVKIAEADEPLQRGTVYLAPEARHLGVTAGLSRVMLSGAPAVGGFQPSATFLFESVAKAFGVRAVGVVLTGMGRDGVDGLRSLREAGGRVIAQNEATSIVYGMPFEAVKEGLAHDILPLGSISRAFVEIGHYEYTAA